jgi:hypothetical protein
VSRENWVVWLNTPGYSAFESPNVLRVSMSRGGVIKLVTSLVPSSFPGAWVTSGHDRPVWVVGDMSDIDVKPVKETGLFLAHQED